MAGGRPTKYKKEFCKKADTFLKSCVDKTLPSGKILVNLPTIEGFALYLEVNKTTLYEWEKATDDKGALLYPEFSNALEKIRTEQHKRLVNCGLSGDYNPTISKLILSSNHGMTERNDLTSKDKRIKGNSIAFVDFDDDETDS